jgi:hypothetical protein
MLLLDDVSDEVLQRAVTVQATSKAYSIIGKSSGLKNSV